MKFGKIAVIALTCLLPVSISLAEDWADASGSCFQKGDRQLTIGFNTWYPGPNVGFDIAFHDAISGGVAGGFNWWGIGYYSYFRIPIVIRAAFHPFNLSVLADKIAIRNRLDVYAGIGTGWRIGWHHWSGPEGVVANAQDVSGFTFRERIGATWYFNPNFYANVEEGSGLGSLNLGIGFKF